MKLRSSVSAAFLCLFMMGALVTVPTASQAQANKEQTEKAEKSKFKPSVIVNKDQSTNLGLWVVGIAAAVILIGVGFYFCSPGATGGGVQITRQMVENWATQPTGIRNAIMRATQELGRQNPDNVKKIHWLNRIATLATQINR